MPTCPDLRPEASTALRIYRFGAGVQRGYRTSDRVARPGARGAGMCVGVRRALPQRGGLQESAAETPGPGVPGTALSARLFLLSGPGVRVDAHPLTDLVPIRDSGLYQWTGVAGPKDVPRRDDVPTTRQLFHGNCRSA